MAAERALNIVRVAGKVPPFRGIIREINARVAEGGLPDAARFLLDKAHVKVSPRWDDQEATEKVLRTKPVIIVANHPNMIEPLFVAYVLPGRPDVYAIASEGIGEIFGGETQSHLLPVKRRGKDKDRLNAESVNKGVDALKNGHAVIIFPDGGDKSQRWRQGVARFADVKDAYLVMMDILGTEHDDIKRLVGGLFRRRGTLTRSLRISAPIEIRDLQIPSGTLSLNERERYEDVASYLQQYYLAWQRGIQPNVNTQI